MLNILLPFAWLLIGEPAVADKPFVEIDLTPLPCEQDRRWEMKFSVSTEKSVYKDSVRVAGMTERFATCEVFVLEMRRTGYEAEVIDKSKIRVYGWTEDDGKFYPATKASVETEGLESNEIPKVKFVGKKG